MTCRDILTAAITSPTTLGHVLGVSPQRADQLLHPAKHRARIILRRAKHHKPLACQMCGSQTADLEAHHYDYEKPKAVLWLCVTCHQSVS